MNGNGATGACTQQANVTHAEYHMRRRGVALKALKLTEKKTRNCTWNLTLCERDWIIDGIKTTCFDRQPGPERIKQSKSMQNKMYAFFSSTGSCKTLDPLYLQCHQQISKARCTHFRDHIVS